MADQKYIDLLKQGIDAWNTWRSNNPTVQPDLGYANLIGVYLGYANLKDVHLNKANLFGANLSKADLSGASLSGADLRGTNLRGASLSEADLRGTDLQDADLEGTTTLRCRSHAGRKEISGRGEAEILAMACSTEMI